ncbi:MAG: hypothetical protein GXX85_14660 [Ignavibacteria bacterium]|nr:hypothetical protein [Ignavibacteria bacterium]
MSLFQNHAGINVTSSKIQLVEVNYKDDCFYLENADEEFFSEFINFGSKETKIISVLQNSFNEIILRKPLNCNSVSFSFPHDFFRIIELPYEETLVKDDLLENIKWELSVLYPETANEEMLIEPVQIPKNIGTETAKIIIFAAFKRYVKIVHKFCVRNNLNLKYVDNVHTAANQLIAMETGSRTEKLVATVFLGEKDFSFSVLKGSFPIHFSVNKFKNAAEILNKISSCREKIAAKNIQVNDIEKIYVFGDLVSDNFTAQLEKIFNIDVVRYNPFRKIKISGSVKKGELLSDKNNSFVSAAGIAFRLV